MAKKDPLSSSIGILESTRNYNRWIYDNIRPYIGRDVLEVGCGIGNLTGFLMENGRYITSVEIEKSFAEYAARKHKKSGNIKIIYGDFLKLKALKKNHFSTVISLNVLEHIENVSAALKKMHSHLSGGGRIITLVPAMHFAFGELDKAVGHYRRYEKSDLIPLYRQNGFQMEKIFYMNFLGVFAWALNSRLLGRKDFPENQPGLFDRFFVPFLKPLEALIPPPLGQSLIAVGKKI